MIVNHVDRFDRTIDLGESTTDLRNRFRIITYVRWSKQISKSMILILELLEIGQQYNYLSFYIV